MLLIVGLVLIVVGISDFAIATVLGRGSTSSSGGLGAQAPPPAARILRATGAVTLVVGVVLTVIALAT